MAEGDESAKLWKVNRTIHELVKDRVSTGYDSRRDLSVLTVRFPIRVLPSQTMKYKWTCRLFDHTMPTRAEASSKFGQ